MKKDNGKKSVVLLSLASFAILLLLFLWRKGLIKTGVTTTINYEGSDITNDRPTLSELIARLRTNEFIQNGKLCANTFGIVTCFDGDPIDVLILR